MKQQSHCAVVKEQQSHCSVVMEPAVDRSVVLNGTGKDGRSQSQAQAIINQILLPPHLNQLQESHV